MTPKNLALKFLLVAGLVIFAIIAIKTKGLKEGIDLKGGHSLIFEIRSPAAENVSLEAQKKDLQDQLATASPEKKTQIEQGIKSINDRIAENNQSASSSANLADRIITILKKRVDPLGVYSLEWRPVGNNRIEVRMPAGQEESREAKDAFTRVMQDAEKHNLSRSQIRRVEQAPPQERDKVLASMSVTPVQAQKLQELAGAYDRVAQGQRELAPLREAVRNAEKATTQPTQPGADPKVKAAREALQKAQDALSNAEIAYQAAQRAIDDGNINQQEVQNVLRNYVSPDEAAALKKNNRKELKRRELTFNNGMASLQEKYKDRQEEIGKIVEAYKNWSNRRKLLDDPTDLVRLIRKSGVLEFRMAPYQASGSNYSISNVEAERYVQQLTREGPEAGFKRNDAYLWFALHGEREGYRGLVTGDHNGRRYVLLSNSGDKTMLNPPGSNKWKLDKAYAGSDQFGAPAVDFVFDPSGAKLFYQLTSTNVGNSMAILLDDEVYSAPRINSAISERGQITGSFTPVEVQELVQTFEAGSLPAKLNPDPVSISSFGSALGEINKNLSIKAGIIALAAVAFFMLVYYLLSGAIADIALALNIILILGAMSAFDAVFTMPGIAGLILSIGMAVDSNVLISERLREEQDRGLPIRMAFKNAYDRAFTAIFDSHLTALITCVVLFWIGTEEVKGFALTLGLGVAFNLFTAVFVTKWVVMVMLEVGMIRTHQYMLRLIHVPKIDWMAKRYYFWAFSLITSILGIMALVSEGGRIWGIEFSAGTQATLVFKNDGLVTEGGKILLPNDRNVADLFKNTASKMASADTKGIDFTKLRDNSRVETVIDPDRVDKFLRTNDPDYNPASNDNKITLDQWKAAGNNVEFFRLLDANGNSVLEQAELAKSLPAAAYTVNTTETRLDVIREVARQAFGTALANRQKISYELATARDPKGQGLAGKLGVPLAMDGHTEIKPTFRQSASPEYRSEFEDFEGGLLLVVDNVSPAVTRAELEQRLDDMRLQPDESLAQTAANPVSFVGLEPGEGQTYKSFAILARPAEGALTGDRAAWGRFADNEAKLVNDVLHREESMTATNYDSQIAGDAKARAIAAVMVSWLAIIAYLWLRFGSASWGLAAVICLVHDSIIVVGMVAASDWISRTAIGQSLLIGSFKIDLAMIAAVLTIIGYSVSDTIVIFDRIRENRGKLKTVSYQVINNSINQTLSRTILTVFTVFIVVFVMYVWAGESIRGFNYALLIGIFFGCYSSIAVASPILLGFKQMVAAKTASVSEPAAPPTQAQNQGTGK